MQKKEQPDLHVHCQQRSWAYTSDSHIFAVLAGRNGLEYKRCNQQLTFQHTHTPCHGQIFKICRAQEYEMNEKTEKI